MDGVGHGALLVQPLELLGRVEEPLVAHQGRVSEQAEEEVGQGVGEAWVRARREEGPSADEVQVDVGEVHQWRQLSAGFKLVTTPELGFLS